MDDNNNRAEAKPRNTSLQRTMTLLDIPLAHLPLRPSTLQTFQKRGFVSLKEVNDAKKGGMASLAAELQLSIAITAGLVREVQSCLENNTDNASGKDHISNVASNRIGVSAAELLANHNENSCSSIITFCRAVDQMLGGGIGLGEITEVSGLPGSGKTQWGMQLAVDARLPVDFGGVAGETIYIDSEGSFAPERCFTMASSLVRHIQHGLRRRKFQTSVGLPAWFTPEGILDGIHVFRVHDEASQQAVIHSLPHFIQQHHKAISDDERRSPIKLIVIDSIAFHYRASGPETDYVQRTQSLMRQASLLASLAFQYKLAVVAINQMTTKFLTNTTNVVSQTCTSTNNNSYMNDLTRSVPALGESWAHAVSTRLLLYGNGSETRQCQILKSPRLPNATADYYIVDWGVRGLEHVEKYPEHQYDSKRAKIVE
jgi:RAD51-like protein 2